ncbi:lytic transglycosylase domain-containing protein [Campylobacter avium]|mgnify:CR=1 FL=1|uniref:lytic transglycosylase domain-containing protein n=1 Tax=Campylobacter avium TaxID=522485 RepID=UPI001D584AD6|nr:lytic transglycosylase domain-containing protein [Campylobacter avium]HJE66193.1 transglycosylase SLT domain-containing protein [Campylobacter avium]
MRILSIFFFLLSLSFANSFSPEYHQKQLEILRNLDIDSAYISDLVFVDNKEELKSLHSKSLIHSAQNYYEFIPIIRQVLHDEEVPEELMYLAIVESGLKSASVSNAKAVGIWQFMEKTATSLGLKVDLYVDERRDPFKSSFAATKYLKNLKDEFGKWYLAILAYNCGNAKLRSAIKEAQSDDLSVLLDPEAKYLPLETRIFIKKILTLAFSAKNEDFLLKNDSYFVNYTREHNFAKVDVPTSVSLKDLAKISNISFEELKRYNPQFRYDFTPPNYDYYMYIPINKLLSYEKNYDPKKIAKVDTSIPKTKIYIVKQGDSLYSIAKKHKITVADIRKYNKIKKDHLSIKQKLIIPLKKEEIKYASVENKKTSKLRSR